MKKILFSIVAWMIVASVNLAWADDIKLGPGDVLKISVYGNPDLSIDTRVNDTGMISYPLIGSVQVGGLSPSAAEKKIAGLLENGGFIKKPQVNIMVSVMESQQVAVLGQVNKPGRYPIEAKRRLTDVLAMAGGVNPEAGDTVTLLHNNGGKTERQTIDLLDIMHSADNAKNPQLVPGDTVYVDRAPRFYIYGEVQRPGAYRVERDMNVVQALSVGGGLSIRGTENGIRIKRRDESGETKVISAHLEDKVRPDDVIYVKESLF
ncbi:MAG TPA: polysaccharide export protein EpsE [Oxalicibacterium sp.]|nr:polysaccharide export protein EpsE [Oxalicibacterium sp.]